MKIMHCKKAADDFGGHNLLNLSLLAAVGNKSLFLFFPFSIC